VSVSFQSVFGEHSEDANLFLWIVEQLVALRARTKTARPRLDAKEVVEQFTYEVVVLEFVFVPQPEANDWYTVASVFRPHYLDAWVVPKHFHKPLLQSFLLGCNLVFEPQFQTHDLASFDGLHDSGSAWSFSGLNIVCIVYIVRAYEVDCASTSVSGCCFEVVCSILQDKYATSPGASHELVDGNLDSIDEAFTQVDLGLRTHCGVVVEHEPIEPFDDGRHPDHVSFEPGHIGACGHGAN